jgi:hypothetical protein
MNETQIRKVGEKPPPIHPISIPEQDEITLPLHFFRCQQNPKKEGNLFINKNYWEGGKQKAPLLQTHTQRSLPRGEIARPK